MKKISVFAVLILLTAALILPVHAQNVDMERKGSITANMTFQGEPVSGGTLTLYRVASLHPFDEELFHYEESFAECGVPLENLSFDTAVKLATHVYNHGMDGLTKAIDEQGVVRFEDLEVGLYLLIQWDPAPGFYELSPFLISLPNNENGVYIYDTQSAPKQTPDERPTEPPTEEPPTEPPTDEPTEPPTQPPTEPPEPNLPQTGLTNWPVPILAVCGFFSLVAGLVLVVKGRKVSDEA